MKVQRPREEEEGDLTSQSSPLTEESGTIQDGSVNGMMLNGVSPGDEPPRWAKYHYPQKRFSVFFRAFVFVDAALAVILWLTGGNSSYFTKNVEHFVFTQSVFDLAVVSLLKAPVFFCLIYYTEAAVIQTINFPHNTHLQSRVTRRLWLLRIMSFLPLVFTIVKGSFVLNDLLTDSAYQGMSRTYYGCVIWCIVSSLITLMLSIFFGKALGKLDSIRVRKFYNDAGQEVDKDGKPVPKKANLARLVGLAKKEAWFLVGGCLSLLVSSAVQTIAPLFFGKVVDAALSSMDELNRTVLILLGIYMVGAVAGLFRSWLFNLAGQRLVARLRKDLFSAVVVQEIAFFDANRTGELCNRLASDTAVLQNAATVNISMLFRYVLQIIGSITLMFYLNASLTGVLLAVVPILSIGAVQFGKFVRRMGKEYQDQLAEAGTHAEESLSSIRTMRTFSGESNAIEVYGKSIFKSYKVGKKLALAQGLMDGVFGLFAYGAISAVLWYGGKLVYENSKDPDTGITAGLLTSFLLYTLQVAMAFALLSSLYGDFMKALGSSTRIFSLMDRCADIFKPTNPLVLPSLSGEIDFKDVRFTYPSRPESEILKGVTFSVRPGQMVALVGPSGGGKSTIVNLIERFYDPNEGTILLGGCDLKLLDETWFRSKISMVSQEPTLFACSIRENIAYGKGATDEEVIEAAKQANAHEFIMSFEEGYDTLVGERGVRLSGGQKQRIAIARALIMDPVLLLLDEATSALDAESEHLVQEAIDRAMKGRTVIVIAHRLSTVRNAHKVIVIDKGQIAEMGTHTELINQDGVYKRLVLRQLMTEDAKPEKRNVTGEESGDDNESKDESMDKTESSGYDGNGGYVNHAMKQDDDNLIDLQ